MIKHDLNDPGNTFPTLIKKQQTVKSTDIPECTFTVTFPFPTSHMAQHTVSIENMADEPAQCQSPCLFSPASPVFYHHH